MLAPQSSDLHSALQSTLALLSEKKRLLDNGRRNEKDHDSCIWFWKNLEGNVPGASGLPASTETRVVWLPLCTADVASYMLVSHETSMYMCTG